MRKLKLQMQMSVDGFVATGPNDEQKWVTWAWEEIKPYVLALNSTADTLVIGRKLAVDYIPHWNHVMSNPADPMYELARIITGFRKIIFSNTLDKVPWNNTELAKGSIVEEIKKLKSQHGKDIMVVGGSSFVSSLIKEGLIDEFHLFVNPVVIGIGIPIFNQLENFSPLKLNQSIIYKSGIVLLNYVNKDE